MAYECITVGRTDRVARIAINRPKKLNALNVQTVLELIAAFEQVRDDADVGVVVLTGEGDKSFAAGADIAELRQLTALEGKVFSERGHRLCSGIENLGKPVIAAVNGFALGGGCELAMACTLRIAVEEARLGQPEVNLGTIPGYGGTQRLARLVPRGVAMELVLSGRILTAREALEIGLVNTVAPRDEFQKAVDDTAAMLLAKPPFALKACMEAVLHGADLSLEDGCRLEASLFALTCGTEDMEEGTAAFLEKRGATFTGR